MAAKEFLYCYKMTHDTGFAPNPYHGVLTLATCKPTIRRCAEVNYWISGWTSNKVQGKNKEWKFSDENQRLIYLAKVTKKIPIEEYWEYYDYKRPKKINNGKHNATNCYGMKKSTSSSYDMGDNIYKPLKGKKGGFKQLPNGGGHDTNNTAHDLSGKFVLICEEFYYFGVENAILKGKIINDNKFVVPRCKKISMDKPIAKQIIDFVTKKYSSGINLKKI